jgi:ubiquinone/menaquinone biosynthesis C-methylase UbiE
MVRRARELASGLANVECVVADSEALPFPDATFTAVLCTSSFHHYPNPQKALSEMRRVLGAEGRLVVADGTADLLSARIADRIMRLVDRSHIRLYRVGELEALLRDADFSHVDVAGTLYGGGYAIIRGRVAT